MSQKNAAAVALGKLGGLAGKGEAKRRSAEHYRLAQLKGVATKKLKRQATVASNEHGHNLGVKES